MRNKTIFAVDIGDTSIVAVLAEVDRKGKVLSIDFSDGKSRGISQGVISDIQMLADSLHKVIESLKSKTKKDVHEAYINVSNCSCQIKHSHAVMPLTERGSKIITQDDIKNINNQARLLGLNIDEEVIYCTPLEYRVDGHGPRKNPLGLYGRKLEVSLLMVIIKMGYKENLIKMLNHTGIEARDLVFSSLATSLSVLEEDQKQQGCVLLDIGATTTSFLVFKDGGLVEVDVIPFGGRAITESIAAKAKIPNDLAEDLKKSYALAFCEDIDENDEILIKKSSAYLPIKRKLICEAAQSELAKFISLLLEKIEKVRTVATGGVVITGGAAQMDGLAELIENKLHMPTKVGKIKGIFLSSTKASLYSTAIGLVSYAVDKQILRKGVADLGKGYLKSLMLKVKNLYQDYF